MKVLVIIPAYNERESIVKTVTKLKNDCPECDYVIINDCSKDDTLKICKEHEFNVVDLPINLGIGGAVQTGYKYAFENDYDVAIQVDADGQHKTEHIKDLVEAIEQGNDFAIGSRFIKKEGFQSTFLRRMGINLYSSIIKVFTGVKITDTTSGFRAAGKKIIKMFANSYPVDYPEPETNAIIARQKYKVIEIPVQMEERDGGKSSITPTKSIYYAVKVGLAVMMACFMKRGDHNG